MIDIFHPGGAFYPKGRRVKANPKLSISFCIASTQKVLPFLLSIILASATYLGSIILYLCENLRILKDTPTTITSRFCNVWVTHHEKSGSSLTTLALEYSPTPKGFYSLIYFNLTHDSLSSFHLTGNCHPIVVNCCLFVTCFVF